MPKLVYECSFISFEHDYPYHQNRVSHRHLFSPFYYFRR